MIALGDIQPRCARVSVSGSVSHTAAMLRSLRACGFDASRPVALVVEGVVEQMLPEPASELFAQLSLVRLNSLGVPSARITPLHSPMGICGDVT
eukprot:361947-Chlamydomonas_euryale.AAC.6